MSYKASLWVVFLMRPIFVVAAFFFSILILKYWTLARKLSLIILNKFTFAELKKTENYARIFLYFFCAAFISAITTTLITYFLILDYFKRKSIEQFRDLYSVFHDIGSSILLVQLLLIIALEMYSTYFLTKFGKKEIALSKP